MRVRYSGLPSGYRRVKYLESTGTQYIITDFIDGTKARVVIDIQFTSNTPYQQRLFGHGYDSDTGSNVSFDAYINGNGMWARATSNGVGNWQSTNIIADTKRHLFDLNLVTNNYIIYTDNTVIYNGANNSTITRQNTDKLTLLSRPDATAEKARAKLFSCKTWNNGVLQGNFIPCIRTSDSKPGLYDTINSVFYTNSGSGEFLYGPYDDSYWTPLYPRLPSAYQEVEYIETSSTGQYINTNFVPTNNTVWEIDTLMATTAARQGRYGDAQRLSLYCQSTSIVEGAIGTYLTTSSNPTIRHTYKLDVTALKFYIDGVEKLTYPSITFNNTDTMYLFGRHNTTASGGLDGDKAGTRIYYSKFYDNGQLVRYFIPCYRKSDSVIGLYDTIKQTFYTNSGSGTFTKGADVNNIVLTHPSYVYAEGTTNLITSIGNVIRCTKYYNGVAIDWTSTSQDTYFYFNLSEAIQQNTTYTLSFTVEGLTQSGVVWAWSNLQSENQYKITIKNGINVMTFTTGTSTQSFFDDVTRKAVKYVMYDFQLEKKDHDTLFTPNGTTRPDNAII